MARSKSKYKSLLFEELEPRLLFSADGAEVVAAEAVEQTVEEEPVIIVDLESEADEATIAVEPEAAEDNPQATEAGEPEENTSDQEEPDSAENTNPSEEPATDGQIGQTTAEESAIVADSEGEETQGNLALELTESTSSTELIFVNDNVQEYELLICDIIDNNSPGNTLDIVILDSSQDGIQQVTDALAVRSELNAIHIITHGNEGAITLGNDWLSNDELHENSDAISSWGDALNDDADILLYGCNVAADDDGQHLTDTLSELTGADVASSDDLTGSSLLGGDWELEYQTGNIEAEVAVSQNAQMQWHRLLDITSGLIGHWTFDSDASDSSSSGFDGTLYNDAAIIGDHSVGTGSLSLDGADDYIDLSSYAATLGTLSEGTIAAWIKTTDTTNYQAIFGTADSNDSSPNQSYAAFGTYQGKLYFDVAEDGWFIFSAYTDAEVADGVWHHVAITVGAAGNSLYIDGNLVDPAAITYDLGDENSTVFLDGVTNADSVHIGVTAENTDHLMDFNGQIDDLRIYDRALSSTDISELFATSEFNTIVVTTTSDLLDGDTSSITGLYADMGADGEISLREAIEAANNTTNIDALTADQIHFNISTADSGYFDPDATPSSGDEYWVITPTSYYGDITDSVIIDATTQTGYTTTPVIELDGTSATGATAAFRLRTSDSTIRGFAIHSFEDEGVEIDGTETAGVADNNIIENNWIGVDAEGNAESIGDDGVLITDGASSNTVRYNVISNSLGNGIEVRENLIAGTSHNEIYGNFIGTDTTGTFDMGNAVKGIQIEHSANNIIGGSLASERNIISGNDNDGIIIWGSGSTLNVVQGNYIGVDVTGNNPLGNSADGINISGGASNNTIGGDRTVGEGNVISGQIGANSDGIEIDNTGANNNKIYGNYIGTNYDGTAAIGNARSGVVIYDGVQGTQVGGTGTGQGNIISGNSGSGIVIDGNGKATTTNNVIAGNYIGLDVTGSVDFGNSKNGVQIFGSASGNLIGGETAGAGNTIAFNTQYGVDVVNGTNNAIVRNSIHSNTLLGINLDSGANNDQNFPVLTSAVTTGTEITITGTINSVASTSFRIEFYANATGDISGYGEGQTLIGIYDITTDGFGNASFSPTMSASVAAGSAISATVSRLDGGDAETDTSEFAQNVIATAAANNAPELSGAGMYLTTISEDTVTNDGDLVSAIIASAGGNPITDVDAGALEGIAIFSLSNSNGTWEYDTGSGWTAVGSVSINSSLLLRDTDSLRFVPSADWNGTELFTFAAWDQTSGAAGTKVDTSTYGGTTAFSSGTAIPSITVSGVNDAPTISVTNSTPTFTENGGPVSLFSGTSVDPIETGDLIDTLQLTVDSLANGNNEILVVDGQSIELTHLNSETTATNSYDVDVNVSGTTATVVITKTGGFSAVAADTLIDGLAYNNTSENPQGAVRLVNLISIKDDGGTAGGGVDTTGIGISSLVTIAAVNDDPTNAGSLPTDLVFIEDTQGKLDLSGINLSDVDAGSSDLTLTISSANGHLQTLGWPGLTLGGSQTVLTLTGNLTDLNDFLNDTNSIDYEHATPNTSGDNVDLITVEITDNGNTGTGGGGTIDLGSVNVDITNVNDAPAGTNKTVTTAEDIDYSFNTTDFGFTDTNDTPADSLSNVIITTVTSNGSLYVDANDNNIVDGGEVLAATDVVSVADITAARFKYKPAADGSGVGYDSFTFQTQDDGGTANSGVDTDPTANTITIDVTPINDAPVITSPAAVNAAENQTAVATVTATDVDGDTPTFSITGGADNTLFSITSGGVLTFNSGPDFETFTDNDNDGVYEVEVTANDGKLGTTAQTILVTVTDVNEAPTLVTLSNTTIDENIDTSGGYSVGSLTTTDQDAVDTTTYTINGGADSALFTIGGAGNDELILTNGILDFETQASYEVTVRITDSGGLTHDQTFTISVNDLNEAPVITSPAAVNAAENQTAVATVTATDVDGDTPTFSITGGADNTLFSITSGGVLTFNSGPDFETFTDADNDGVYEVEVTANDGNLGTAAQTILVTVTDVNEAPTLVTLSNTTVDENTDTSGGYSVGSLTTTDQDAVDTTAYTINGGADSALFTIGGAGNDELILTDGILDFETQASYEVTVRITDSGGLTHDQTFTISVNDLNEAPVITSPAAVNAAENQTAVATVTATDEDGDTPTFSITGGADNTLFSITSGGVLTFNTGRDFETFTDADNDGVYEVEVTANDGNSGTSSQTILVTVTDVNEAPTLVTLSNTTVDENTDTSGGYSVGSLTTIDQDAVDTTAYTINGGADSALFTIGGAGNDELILTNGILDFETQASYEVTVRITDSGGLTHDQTFTISVNDLNEAPTFDSAAITTGTQDIAYTYNITASDVDGNGLTITAPTLPTWLSLVDNGDGTATLNGTPTNLEVGDHSVTLQVSDGSLIDNQSFTLTVSNTNDAPVITSPAAVNAAENQTAVATVTATDVDGDTPTFSITGGADNTLFSITSGGVLTFNTGRDFETFTDDDTDGVYEVIVTANDGNSGTSSQTILVTVTDVNEAPTLVTLSNATIDENIDTSGGYSVGSLTTTDQDAVDTTTYTINGGADSALFTIGGAGNDELILTDGILDFETQASYEVTVRITDSGGLTHDQTFTISVNDLNEAPVITSPAAVNAAENQTSVATVTATDEDGDTPTFSITGGADNALFSITSGGVLTFNSGPDFETFTDNDNDGVYEVEVTANDGKLGTTAQTILVTVTDVNEAPTLVTLSNTTVDENTDTSGGYSVGSLTTADQDAVDTTAYTINGGADSALFTIGGAGNDELILTNGILDFETQASYEVTVQITDSGGLTHDQTFTISVNDLNEAPVITSPAAVNAAENQIAVATVTATDVDGDTPTFSITGGADNTLFSITSGGVLTFNSGPDFETFNDDDTNGVYEIEVTANDGNSGTSSQTILVTVTDVNEAPTLVTLSNTTIDENIDTSGGYSVGSLTTTDQDAVDTTAYTINGGADNALFTIGGAGNDELILTDGILDFETQASYEVTVRITDSGGLTHDQTFTVDVNDLNDAPVLDLIGDQTVNELATLSFTATATDSDLPANTLTFSLDAASLALGMSITAGGDFSWTPTESQDGAHTVTVTVTDDGSGTLSGSETFIIAVNEINNNDPIATDDSITVDEGATITTLDGGATSVLTNDTDADLPSDSLTVTLGIGPGHGSLILNVDGTFSYTHDGSENFSDSFTYIVSDADGGITDTGIVSITVNPVNDNAPTAADDFISGDEDSVISGTVLGNDNDVDGNPLTASLVTGPANGSLTLNSDGSFSYIPNPNWNGTDSFTYTANDGTQNSNVATATITVNGVNDAPSIAGVNTGSVTEDIDPDLDTLIEAFGALTISDPDVGESNFQAATVAGTYGDLTIDASGNWSYNANNTQAPIQQLDAGQTLTDTLSVATADGTIQIITVTINGAEDASVIGGTATGSVVEDGTLSVTNTLTITDVDTSDNPINFIDEVPTLGDNGYGTFVMSGNSWSYTLNNGDAAVQALNDGQSLTDTHTFIASDGSNQSVTVTVNGSTEAVVIVPDPDPDPIPDPDPDPIPDPDPTTDPDPIPDPDPDPTTDPPPDDEGDPDPTEEDNPDDTYIPPATEIDTTPVEDEMPVDENPAENVAVRILNSPDVDPITETANAAETSVESEEQYLGYVAADSGQFIHQAQESGELKKQLIKHNYTSVLLQSFRAALHEASEFLISPVSAAPIYMDTVDMSSIMENPIMRDQLEILHQEMDESFEKSAEEQKTVVYAVSGVSATFAAGVVSYLLRAGSLMTSFLATMPIWKGFDPVSILIAPKEKSKKDKKTKDMPTSEDASESMFTEN